MNETDQQQRLNEYLRAMTERPVPYPCPACGEQRLRLETRPELIAQPAGGWFDTDWTAPAVEFDWPWLVCDGCHQEERGQVDMMRIPR